MTAEHVGGIWVFLAQVFNFCPYTPGDMYCDAVAPNGILWWYEKAKKINDDNRRALKR